MCARAHVHTEAYMQTQFLHGRSEKNHLLEFHTRVLWRGGTPVRFYIAIIIIGSKYKIYICIYICTCCRERQAIRAIRFTSAAEDRDIWTERKGSDASSCVEWPLVVPWKLADMTGWDRERKKTARKRKSEKEGAGGKKRLAQQYRRESLWDALVRAGGACHRRGTSRNGKSNVNLEKTYEDGTNDG